MQKCSLVEPEPQRLTEGVWTMHRAYWVGGLEKSLWVLDPLPGTGGVLQHVYIQLYYIQPRHGVSISLQCVCVCVCAREH